jgi:hypothetical protein
MYDADIVYEKRRPDRTGCVGGVSRMAREVAGTAIEDAQNPSSDRSIEPDRSV